MPRDQASPEVSRASRKPRAVHVGWAEPLDGRSSLAFASVSVECAPLRCAWPRGARLKGSLASGGLWIPGLGVKQDLGRCWLREEKA